MENMEDKFENMESKFELTLKQLDAIGGAIHALRWHVQQHPVAMDQKLLQDAVDALEEINILA